MVTCCAYGCTNRSGTANHEKKLSFFRFPSEKDQERRQAWIRAVRREKWVPTLHSYLCSLHFSADQINLTYPSGPRLRDGAVPNLFSTYPAYLQLTPKEKRNPPSERHQLATQPSCKVMPPMEVMMRIKEEQQEEVDAYEPQQEMRVKKEPPTDSEDESQERSEKTAEMITSMEDQWYPVQIKEEPQEEDIDKNGAEIKEPFTNLEEEQQEETEENEEEEVKRPVAVYLPVKVEQEQEEEEEEEEELAPPIAVFLMTKEEPKEEDEEEVEDPSRFSDASKKKEEISESSGRESAVEGTSSDSQASVRSTNGQHTREETYHCSICLKNISKERWTVHMKIHSGEKNYQCSVCQKKFSEKVTLDVHMRIHTREKRHVCSVCQTSFTQSGSLARHMRIHTGERPYQCSICERNFYNKSNLNTHMLSHTGEKKHQCSVCQRSFSLKKNLVKHALVHTGERPYPCSVCGKGFIQRGSLVEHMRTHTGESSIHNCSICQKSFTQRGNLNVHMLTHTGEKPHSCSICHKSFNQGGNLVRHMRTHTGEKSHNCSICQKSFNRRGHLELHMQTHTS